MARTHGVSRLGHCRSGYCCLPRDQCVPPSTQNLLDTIINDVGNRSLADVDYQWAENWVCAMQIEWAFHYGRDWIRVAARIYRFGDRRALAGVCIRPLGGLHHTVSVSKLVPRR
jgi:hypothetical protein